MSNPDQQFEVVLPEAKTDQQVDLGLPKVVVAPQVPSSPPAAVVTDDDTAASDEGEVDERQRTTEQISAKRPVSWGIRLSVLLGVLAVAAVTFGIYRSVATSVHNPLIAPPTAADIASADGLRHWAKDQQTWLNGTLLPDQQAQWKEIDALKAQVASLQSQLAAAKTPGTAPAVSDKMSLAALVMSIVAVIGVFGLMILGSRRRRDAGNET